MKIVCRMVSLFLGVIFCFASTNLIWAHDFGGTTLGGTQPPAGTPQGCGGNCCSKNMVGKSVFLYDGSEYFEVADLKIKGILSIVVVRFYNSQSTFDSPVGYGWDLAYNQRLRTYADQSVVIRNNTGFKKRFVYTGGSYVEDCNCQGSGTLERMGDGTFVYTLRGGTGYFFDILGRLSKIQDPHGNSLRFSYTDDKLPLSGVSPYGIDPDTPMVVSLDYRLARIEEWTAENTFTGHFVNFSYAADTGRLASVTDSSGRVISYHHDAKGNLIRVDLPENLYLAYQYEDAADIHNITGRLRGYGTESPVLVYSNTYDSDDRVISEEYAGGTLDFDYAIPLQKTIVSKTIRDSGGTVLNQQKTVYMFNEIGKISKVLTDNLSIDSYFDSRSRIVQQSLFRNRGTADNPDLIGESSTYFTYGSNDMLASMSLPVSSQERIVRKFFYENSRINKIQQFFQSSPQELNEVNFSFNYNNGIPVSIASIRRLVSNGDTPVYRTVSFLYNANGQLTEKRYENNDVKSFQYASTGLLTEADGIKYNFDSRGNVIVVEDRNGNRTSFTYDDMDRVTKVTDALGAESLYTYTGWDLTGIEEGKMGTTPGRKYSFTHDQYGRVTQYSMDNAGTPVLQGQYTYDSENNVLSVTDQRNNTIFYTYDAVNHLLSVKDSSNNTTTYDYTFNGQLKSVTDALGNTSVYEYDKAGLLVDVSDALGHMTRFSYNAQGDMIRVTNPLGEEYTFGYDLTGRMIWKNSPAEGREDYLYDNKGRLISRSGPDGLVNTFNYDSYDRVLREDLSLASGDSATHLYQYDAMGNLLSYTDTSVSSSPIFSMTYDPLNRLASKIFHPVNKTLQYDYTSWGARSGITLLDGSTQLLSYQYSFDAAGTLAAITTMPGNQTYSFQYDAAGYLVSRTYPSGTRENLLYSPVGLLEELYYQNSDNTTLQQLHYSHDSVGHITSITDQAGTTVFNYDALGRLLAADYPSAKGLVDEQYSYDAVGRRKSSAEFANWSYDSAGRLLGYGTTSFTYDGRGNRNGKTDAQGTEQFFYDAFNRLTRVVTGDTEIQYAYGMDSQRIKKTNGTTVTWYLYDGSGLMATFDQNGQLLRSYTRDLQQNLLGVSDNTGNFTVLTDHIHNPARVLDGSETVLMTAEHEAFGRNTVNEDPDGNGASFRLAQRFPGQHKDEETSLFYNWHRYYDPDTGQYISPDPLGLSAGYNLYAYSENDPVNNFDPNGMLSNRACLFGRGLALTVIGTAAMVGVATATAATSPVILFLGAIGSVGSLSMGGTEVLMAGLARNEREAGQMYDDACTAENLVNPIGGLTYVGTLAVTGSKQTAGDVTTLVLLPVDIATGTFKPPVGPNLTRLSRLSTVAPSYTALAFRGNDIIKMATRPSAVSGQGTKTGTLTLMPRPCPIDRGAETRSGDEHRTVVFQVQQVYLLENPLNLSEFEQQLFGFKKFALQTFPGRSPAVYILHE